MKNSNFYPRILKEAKYLTLENNPLYGITTYTVKVDCSKYYNINKIIAMFVEISILILLLLLAQRILYIAHLFILTTVVLCKF